MSHTPLKRRRLSFTPASQVQQYTQSDRKDYRVKKFASKMTLFKIPKKTYLESLMPRMSITNKFFYPGCLLPNTIPIRGQAANSEIQLTSNWRLPSDTSGTFECNQISGTNAGYGNQLLLQFPINSLMEVAAMDNKLQADFFGGHEAAIQLPKLLYPEPPEPQEFQNRMRNIIIEQYKVVYTIENVTNNDIQIELCVMKPKRIISELKTDGRYESVSLTGDVTLMHVESYVNNTPLGFLKHDVATNAGILNNTLPYNISPTYSGTGVVCDDRLRPFSSNNKSMNYNYSTVQRNSFKLQPGSKIKYEITIPGHQVDFDSISEYSKTMLRAYSAAPAGTRVDFTESMQPCWYHGSRFLIVRAYGETLTNPTIGNKGGFTAASLKIATKATKFASYRRIQKNMRHTVLDVTMSDIDALGLSAPTSCLMDTLGTTSQVDINPDANTNLTQGFI